MLRNTGMVLTPVGSALILMGVALYLVGPGNEGFPSRELGAITMAGGGIVLGTGIPIWIYGSHRMREAAQRSIPASCSAFVAPIPGGVMTGISIATF